jgi:hypothetical protein
MLGVDSRAALLRSLGQSLLAHPDVFGAEGRPGNLVGRESHLCQALHISQAPANNKDARPYA